jgi:hypothetical protein
MSLPLLLTQVVALEPPRARQARLNELRNRIGVRAGAPLDPTPYLRRLRWVAETQGVARAMMVHMMLTHLWRDGEWRVAEGAEAQSLKSILGLPGIGFSVEPDMLSKDVTEAEKSYRDSLWRFLCVPVWVDTPRARWVPRLASWLSTGVVKALQDAIDEANVPLSSDSVHRGIPTTRVVGAETEHHGSPDEDWAAETFIVKEPLPRWLWECKVRNLRWHAVSTESMERARRDWNLGEALACRFEEQAGRDEPEGMTMPGLFDWLVQVDPPIEPWWQLHHALIGANLWHMELARQAELAKTDESMLALQQRPLVKRWDDGWELRALETPEQLQAEGDLLGHCIGGYSGHLGHEDEVFYSLHDPKGNPRISIQATTRWVRDAVGEFSIHIAQAYGRANTIASGQRAWPTYRALRSIGAEPREACRWIDEIKETLSPVFEESARLRKEGVELNDEVVDRMVSSVFVTDPIQRDALRRDIFFELIETGFDSVTAWDAMIVQKRGRSSKGQQLSFSEPMLRAAWEGAGRRGGDSPWDRALLLDLIDMWSLGDREKAAVRAVVPGPFSEYLLSRMGRGSVTETTMISMDDADMLISFGVPLSVVLMRDWNRLELEAWNDLDRIEELAETGAASQLVRAFFRDLSHDQQYEVHYFDPGFVPRLMAMGMQQHAPSKLEISKETTKHGVERLISNKLWHARQMIEHGIDKLPSWESTAPWKAWLLSEIQELHNRFEQGSSVELDRLLRSKSPGIRTDILIHMTPREILEIRPGEPGHQNIASGTIKFPTRFESRRWEDPSLKIHVVFPHGYSRGRVRGGEMAIALSFEKGGKGEEWEIPIHVADGAENFALLVKRLKGALSHTHRDGPEAILAALIAVVPPYELDGPFEGIPF